MCTYLAFTTFFASYIYSALSTQVTYRVFSNWLFVLIIYSCQSILEMQRIIVKCFWQYLSLSTFDTNVILYEIKAFYLVSDNLFRFFFTSPSKPQHLQIKKFNTASVRTSFLTAQPRRPRGSQSGRVKRRDESFQPVLENFCRAFSPAPGSPRMLTAKRAERKM